MGICLAFNPSVPHTYSGNQLIQSTSEVDLSLGFVPNNPGDALGWQSITTLNLNDTITSRSVKGTSFALILSGSAEAFSFPVIGSETTIDLSTTAGGPGITFMDLIGQKTSIGVLGAAATPVSAAKVIGHLVEVNFNGALNSATELTVLNLKTVNTGAVSTLHGLKIENISGASISNFAIQTGIGLVRFGDNAQVSRGNVAAEILISAGNGFEKAFILAQGGTRRWGSASGATVEGGANTGSPYLLSAYTDAGVLIDSPVSIFRASGGSISIGGATNRPVLFTGTIAPGVFTVAALPAGSTGFRATVNNALAPVFGNIVAGGGAVTVPVYWDGAAWMVG